LLQGGIFEALMSWGIFLMIVFLHYLNFKDTDAKKRALADCVYYGLLVIWLVGVIVDYAVLK
jgi:amino acid transporter